MEKRRSSRPCARRQPGGCRHPRRPRNASAGNRGALRSRGPLHRCRRLAARPAGRRLGTARPAEPRPAGRGARSRDLAGEATGRRPRPGAGARPGRAAGADHVPAGRGAP